MNGLEISRRNFLRAGQFREDSSAQSNFRNSGGGAFGGILEIAVARQSAMEPQP
jgi:hypothetical protein